MHTHLGTGSARYDADLTSWLCPQVRKACSPSCSHHIFCENNKQLHQDRRGAVKTMVEELERVQRKATDILHERRRLANGRTGIVSVVYDDESHDDLVLKFMEEEPNPTSAASPHLSITTTSTTPSMLATVTTRPFPVFGRVHGSTSTAAGSSCMACVPTALDAAIVHEEREGGAVSATDEAGMWTLS